LALGGINRCYPSAGSVVDGLLQQIGISGFGRVPLAVALKRSAVCSPRSPSR
jgi:hypothetical protein